MVWAMVAERETIMWVFCGGMQRSGSTLQYQLAARIVEAANAGQRVTWMPSGELDIRLKDYRGPGIDVIKTHVPTQGVIDRVTDGFARALYIYRDLRDVIVSTMHRYGISFDRVWNEGMINNAVDYGRTWEGLPRVLTQRYEELSVNLLQGVDEICNHIGLNASMPDKVHIAAGHLIHRQRQRIGNIPKGIAWDQYELLHRRHISPANGVSGQWRIALDNGQIKMVEQRYGGWLTGHGYRLSSQE